MAISGQIKQTDLTAATTSADYGVAPDRRRLYNFSDRIAECAKKIYSNIYVNVQGDEPLIDPKTIDKVVKNLIYNKNKKVLATNAYHVITNNKDIEDKNVIKTIIDNNNNALAFSRNAIPFTKNKNHKFYRQIGLYAFTKKGISLFSKLKSSTLEKNEAVEMYRIIENSYLVKMIKVDKSSKSVDTKSDLRIIRKLIKWLIKQCFYLNII